MWVNSGPSNKKGFGSIYPSSKGGRFLGGLCFFNTNSGVLPMIVSGLRGPSTIPELAASGSLSAPGIDWRAAPWHPVDSLHSLPMSAIKYLELFQHVQHHCHYIDFSSSPSAGWFRSKAKKQKLPQKSLPKRLDVLQVPRRLPHPPPRHVCRPNRDRPFLQSRIF